MKWVWEYVRDEIVGRIRDEMKEWKNIREDNPKSDWRKNNILKIVIALNCILIGGYFSKEILGYILGKKNINPAGDKEENKVDLGVKSEEEVG